MHLISNDVVYSSPDSSHSDYSVGGTLVCTLGDVRSAGQRLLDDLDYLGYIVEWGDGKS